MGLICAHAAKLGIADPDGANTSGKAEGAGSQLDILISSAIRIAGTRVIESIDDGRGAA